jgi:hypothetical protein
VSRHPAPTAAVLLRGAALLSLAGAMSAGACRARPDRCGDPVAVAKAFVASMEGSDPASALGFLSQAANRDLERRAKEASDRLGQTVAAADLLVPERSVLPRAEWLVLRSAVGGEAWVDVRPPADAGTEALGPWSTQRMVREDGCWKVDLFHRAGLPLGEPPTFLDRPSAAPTAGE